MEDGLIEIVADFAFGGCIGVMSWFLGGKDGFLLMLLALMVVDQLSGLAVGWTEHKLSSEVGFKGLLKKCIILGFVGMAHLMDKYMLAHTVMGETETVRTGVCVFYIANEGISIIENADKLNVPIPEFLRKRIHQLRDIPQKKKAKQNDTV